MKDYQNLIKEICEEEKISFTLLSKDWIMMLEKENKIKFISGYKFDLARHAIGNIIDDKYATYEILKAKKIPIISHHILFAPHNQNDYAKNSNHYEKAFELFEKYNHRIVIKANIGTCGQEVFYISEKEKITSCLDQLWKKNHSISICPYYQIKKEYRLIMLDQENLLSYEKQKPIIVGDGKKTKKELLMELNPFYFSSKLTEDDGNEILKAGEIFEYSWKFNLSNGAIPMEITSETTKEKLLEIASKITNSFDLGFCSIDIVETEEQEFFVMEINSGVMMLNYMNIMKNGKEIAKSIYRSAILKMFEESSKNKK